MGRITIIFPIMIPNFLIMQKLDECQLFSIFFEVYNKREVTYVS